MNKVSKGVISIVALAIVAVCGYAVGNSTAKTAPMTNVQATPLQQSQTQTNNQSTKTNKDNKMALSQETKDALKAYAAIMYSQTKMQFDLNSEEEQYLADQFLAASKGEFKFEDFSDDQHKKIQSYLGERAQKVQLAVFDKISKENLEKGKEALEKFAKEPNAVKDPSGLVYIITKDGNGAQVKETDTVKVTYKGTHLDGSVFDQQLDDKNPVEFPLDRVVPGFKIALSKLKVGGSIKVMIPANLAYGEQGAGRSIMPNETLVFEVTVHDIVKK